MSAAVLYWSCMSTRASVLVAHCYRLLLNLFRINGDFAPVVPVWCYTINRRLPARSRFVQVAHQRQLCLGAWSLVRVGAGFVLVAPIGAGPV